MAARRSGTAALRWWSPRRSNIKRGRASTDSGEPSAQGCTADGGGRCSSHGVGRGGDAPARLGSGAEALPVRLVANASAVSLRGDGGVVAVVEKRGGSS